MICYVNKKDIVHILEKIIDKFIKIAFEILIYIKSSLRNI